MFSVHFQGKLFNMTVIQVYALTSDAEEAEIEWFYEDLQDFLGLTPKKKKKKKDVLLFIGDWNAKVVTTTTWSDGKVWLGVQNEAGQRLTDFCQENTLIIANTLVQQHKRQLYTCTPPDSQHRNQTDYILCSQRWKALHSQQKQDLELTLAPFTSPYCKIQT